MTNKEDNWRGVITASVERWRNSVNRANLTEVDRSQQISDLNRAYLNLVSTISRKIKGALVKAQKSVLIPRNLTGRQLAKTAENIDTQISATR